MILLNPVLGIKNALFNSNKYNTNVNKIFDINKKIQGFLHIIGVQNQPIP